MKKCPSCGAMHDEAGKLCKFCQKANDWAKKQIGLFQIDLFFMMLMAVFALIVVLLAGL